MIINWCVISINYPAVKSNYLRTWVDFIKHHNRVVLIAISWSWCVYSFNVWGHHLEVWNQNWKIFICPLCRFSTFCFLVFHAIYRWQVFYLQSLQFLSFVVKMVFCDLISYMSLKKGNLQECYWKENRLILQFRDNKFKGSNSAFIQSVWEVYCPCNDIVIECGFYTTNSHDDVYNLGTKLDDFLGKLPVGVWCLSSSESFWFIMWCGSIQDLVSSGLCPFCPLCFFFSYIILVQFHLAWPLPLEFVVFLQPEESFYLDPENITWQLYHACVSIIVSSSPCYHTLLCLHTAAVGIWCLISFIWL